MKKKIVSIFGGTGFIGKYLVNSLLQNGYYVNVLSRNAQKKKKDITTFKLGQCRYFNCNIKDKKKIKEILVDSNIVINLIGLLINTKKNSFEDIHVQGLKNLVSVCKELGIEKIIHLSAIGANDKSLSTYSQTKYKGEKVLKNFKNYTILRPSIVYGDEDNFINLFAKMAKISPFLPLIGKGATKFQPIWVQDLVNIILLTCNTKYLTNKLIEVGGQDIISFKEIINAILDELKLKRILINIPFSIANNMAYFSEIFPKPFITRDQVEMLKSNNIVSRNKDYRRYINYATQPFNIMLTRQMISHTTKGGHLSS